MIARWDSRSKDGASDGNEGGVDLARAIRSLNNGSWESTA